MTKPTERGKKYLQLTDNILAEYIYVADRYNVTDIDNDILDTNEDGFLGTYGRASNNDSENTNKYLIAHNDYTGEVYFMNDYDSQQTTNNTLSNSILPIRKDVTQWVETKDKNDKWYVDYDSKWCSNMAINTPIVEQSLLSNPNHTEYIPYDILRIYFQSGYHSEYDGFVINLYSKNKTSTYINLLSVAHHNNDNMKMTTEPMWFADKIYTEYIEYRVPSIAYLSSDCIGGLTESMRNQDANGWGSYNRSEPKTAPGEQTLPSYITSGYGFYSNPALGIDLHAIVGNTEKHNFTILKTRALVSTLFPNKDSYDQLIASVRPATDGDYYKIYGYFENNPLSPIYDDDSLYEYLDKFDGTFTITHIITVTERYVQNDETTDPITFTHAPMTYIQTWDMLKEMYEDNSSGYTPIIKFRPVLEHTAGMIGPDCGASINYTLRIISNKDNTSIIKSSSCEIINPRRFGLNFINATLNSVNDVHVYNRIMPSPTININEVVSPIGAPSSKDKTSIVVNKYVTSSFIDRRNIRVSVSPVRIDNIE